MSTLDFLDTREKRLSALFGGCFHQDWRDFQPTPRDVIDDYIASHGRELLRVVVVDLRWLVAQVDDSRKLWRVLASQYDCQFAGANLGLNAHTWVNAIADQIENACKQD